jgi:hypothetical protein
MDGDEQMAVPHLRPSCGFDANRLPPRLINFTLAGPFLLLRLLFSQMAPARPAGACNKGVRRYGLVKAGRFPRPG